MGHDKKNRNGRTLFVLLQDIENPKFDQSVPEDAIFEAFEVYKNL
jgi:3-dehydroquinate synthase